MKHINEYLINKDTKRKDYINAVDDLDFDYALIWDDTIEFYTKERLKDELNKFLKSEDPTDEDIAMAFDDLLDIKEVRTWKKLSGPVFTGDIKQPFGMRLR